VICNEGTGVEPIKAAMNAGGRGATLEKVQLLPHPGAYGQPPSPACVICWLMVSKASMPAIIHVMEHAGALSDTIQAMLYHGEAPKAFTYTASRRYRNMPGRSATAYVQLRRRHSIPCSTLPAQLWREL
jgi:hypothetical protein